MTKDKLTSSGRKSNYLDTFDYWHGQYKNASSVVGFKLSPLLKMLKHANSFEQLRIVHDEARKCHQLKERREALKRMSKRALTFNEWCIICERVDSGSKLERIAIRKIYELAGSFEERYLVYTKTDPRRLSSSGATKQMFQYMSKYHKLALDKISMPQ